MSYYRKSVLGRSRIEIVKNEYARFKIKYISMHPEVLELYDNCNVMHKLNLCSANPHHSGHINEFEAQA